MTPDQSELIEPGPFGEGASGAVPSESEGGGDVVAAGGASAPPEGAPAAQVIFKGLQKEFTSVEELSRHTLELERQVIEQQARLSGLSAVSIPAQGDAQAAQPKPSGFDSKALGEEFILNPASAVEKIVAHVRSSILGDVQRQTSSNEFYRAFYEANEDLVGCEELVDAAVNKNFEAWKNVPAEQAAKLLAIEVRAKADKIRGSVPGAQVLSSKPAHALPSGGAPAPKIAAPAAKSKVLSFSEQLAQQQAKHKKRA